MLELPVDLPGELVSRPGDGHSLLRAALLLFGLITCLSFEGCQKEETKPAPAVAKSAVVVKISKESITASTASAQFRLSPSGALTATRVGRKEQPRWRANLLISRRLSRQEGRSIPECSSTSSRRKCVIPPENSARWESISR